MSGYCGGRKYPAYEDRGVNRAETEYHKELPASLREKGYLMVRRNNKL